jgi:predicted MFS family arabinose efflux permease
VTAFQVGIAAGSLVGVAGLLYEGSVAVMLSASAGLMAIALAGMAANRQLLDHPPASAVPTSQDE